MDESQMRVDVESPYLKLTRTPLARATTLCGIGASKVALGVSVAYILFDLIPGFFFAWMISQKLTPAEIRGDDDDNKPRNQRYAAIGLIVFFGIISLIGMGFFIYGITHRNSIMVFRSYSSLQINLLCGRLSPTMLLYVIHLRDLAILMSSLTCLDIIIMCFSLFILGKFVGECRNIRYAKCRAHDYAAVPTSVNLFNQAGNTSMV